ncbi:MAG: CHAT domain-containing protein [Planctomycetes bacterium]|nr:CHAT domain-containing protein [Planctomycetota bacterium]
MPSKGSLPFPMPLFCPCVLTVALVAASPSLAAQDGPGPDPRTACAELLRATWTEPATRPVEHVVEAVFAAKTTGPSAGSLASVQRALAAADALVEFVQWTAPAGERVTAFVVRPEHPVARVELGPAAAIEQAVVAHLRLLVRWQQPLDATSRRLGDDMARRLRNLVLAPLEPALASCQRIWFAADGVLLPLPFEALPAANAGTFLLEAVDVRRLHCGTDLLAETATAGRGLLVVDGGATDLPEAAREARAIAGSWDAAGRGPVQVRRASELGELATGVRGFGYLHFATRGEFVRNGGPAPASGRAVEATASAHPATAIDLAACRLVVVSAGDPLDGEAVPGLAQVDFRRSLRRAGARTVVTTCWPVDDLFVREWMEQFWQGLRTDADPAIVGRQTKLAWLERNRRLHLDPLPGRWAAIAFEGH